MVAHRFARRIRLPRLDQVKYALVFANERGALMGGVEIYQMAEQQALRIICIFKRPCGLDEPFIAGRDRNCLMEQIVEMMRDPPLRMRMLEAGERRSHPVEILLGSPPRCEAGSLGLDGQAELEVV